MKPNHTIGLRKDNRAIVVGKALLLMSLITVSTYGTYVVFFENDYVKIEGGVRDIHDGEPVTFYLDIQVTNKRDYDLVVQTLVVTVWADQSKTVLLAHEEVEPLYVPALQTRAISQLVEVHHADQMGSSVFVEWSSSWNHGGTPGQSKGTRTVDVNAAMAAWFGS